MVMEELEERRGNAKPTGDGTDSVRLRPNLNIEFALPRYLNGKLEETL